MRQAQRGAYGIVLFLVLTSTPSLVGQQIPLRLGRGGELGMTFGSDRLRIERDFLNTGSDRSVWLKFPISGFLLTPELLSFNVELRPTRVWQDQDAFTGTQQFNQLNMAYGVSIFPGRTLSLSLNGSRVDATTHGGPGGRRESNQRQFGAQVWLRFRPLPIQASYRRQLYNDTWTPDPGVTFPFQNAVILKSYQITATNSKLSLQAQRTTYDDLVRDQDTETWSANGVHTFRWGRGSQLESTISFSDQTGAFPNYRREWSERLKLYHARTVRTEYTYARTQFRTPGGFATNRSYSAAASITAIRRVGLGMLVAGSSSESAGSENRSLLFAPRLGFSIGQVRGGRIEANALVGFERRSVLGNGSEIPILDEPHSLSAARSFALEEPDVVVETIVVRSADGTITYVEGPDYRVLHGTRITRIQVPLTSRIDVGDQLLVSYRVLGLGRGEANGLRADVTVAAEWKGFTLRHQRSLRQSPTEDATVTRASNDRRLENFDDTHTRLSFRGRLPLGNLDFGAGVRDRLFGDHRALEYEVSGGLATPPLGPLTATLYSGWTSTESEERSQKTLFLSAGLAWNIGIFRFDGSVERTTIESSDVDPQRWIIGRGTAALQIERVLVEARAEFLRERVPVERARSRLSLRVIRQF